MNPNSTKLVVRLSGAAQTMWPHRTAFARAGARFRVRRRYRAPTGTRSWQDFAGRSACDGTDPIQKHMRAHSFENEIGLTTEIPHKLP